MIKLKYTQLCLFRLIGRIDTIHIHERYRAFKKDDTI